MIDVVQAEPGHIAVLAAAMRQAERDECAAYGLTPLEGMRYAFDHAALAWTGRADGEPVCMFGVSAAALVAPEGRPWLLSTDGILPHQHAFLRRNRAYVGTMLQAFPRLADWVDARNAVSIRWLRWLGFTIRQAVPFGIHGELFHPFEMEA